MANTTANQEHLIDVRYSKFYTVFTIVLSLLFFTLAWLEIRSRWGGPFSVFEIIWLSGFFVIGLIILYSGITLRTRRYLRLDNKNNILRVYGIIGSWSRKHPFDTIYQSDSKVYIEKDGKKKWINILNYASDRSDLNRFLQHL